jgi:hypothetical protein
MNDAPNRSQLLIYEAENGAIKIDVRFEGETVWLTQQLMADLFLTTKQNVGQHLKNIFDEGELVPTAVVKNFFTTAADGKNYSANFYNLDAIISVGYRVKSRVAIAKNYLAEPELGALNNLVEQYLIFAEGQAMRRIPMHMADWIGKLDGFLNLNDRSILTHVGKISHELALTHAEQEYDSFQRQRLTEHATQPDDFDKCVKQLAAAKARRKKKGDKA